MRLAACIGTIILVLCLIKQTGSSDNVKDFVDELVYRSCPSDVFQMSLCTSSGLGTHTETQSFAQRHRAGLRTHTETQSFASLKHLLRRILWKELFHS